MNWLKKLFNIDNIDPRTIYSHECPVLRVEMGENDLLVCTTTKCLSADQRDNVTKAIQAVVSSPAARALILDDGMTFQIVKRHPRRKVVIVEEVPECEPHWFLRFPGVEFHNAQGGRHYGDSPKFDTYAGAEAFCVTMGWDYTVERFEL